MGLKWSYINLESGHIHVQRSLARAKNQGLFFKSVKTESSDRIVVVSGYVLNLLNEHKQRQEILKNKLEEYFIDNDLVNCTSDGKPIVPRNLL